MIVFVYRPIPAKSVVVLQLQVKECEGVEVLEHVQAKLTIFSQRRGDLNIQLTSPMGTRVTLLAHRAHDNSRAGFNVWPFMSVHSWGESPFGTWQLEIHNDGRLLGKSDPCCLLPFTNKTAITNATAFQGEPRYKIGRWFFMEPSISFPVFLTIVILTN